MLLCRTCSKLDEILLTDINTVYLLYLCLFDLVYNLPPAGRSEVITCHCRNMIVVISVICLQLVPGRVFILLVSTVAAWFSSNALVLNTAVIVR